MLTHRMLGLLHTRLVANAPRQAGSDEYRMGVDDAIAAVQRLIEPGMPSSLTATWMRSETVEAAAAPDQTRLAARYLQLEVTSLLRTIDSMLRLPSTPRLPEDEDTSSLLDARAHLIEARDTLRQAHGPTSG